LSIKEEENSGTQLSGGYTTRAQQSAQKNNAWKKRIICHAQTILNAHLVKAPAFGAGEPVASVAGGAVP
jgi:hypothetical protein